MRMFILRRDEDPTGISGTGTVAEGVEFTDGKVMLKWVVGEHRSTVYWENMDAVRAIHGHDGKTEVVYIEFIHMQHADMLAEALRLTQEYVGPATLPAEPGWSWYDALEAHKRLRSDE